MSLILKIAKQDNKKRPYSFYDPIIDPAIDRDYEDYYKTRKNLSGGAIIGGALGALYAASPYIANARLPVGERLPIENIGGHIGRAAMITATGAAIGATAGEIKSSYDKYKRRYNANQEIHNEYERDYKMQNNIGPKLRVNAGPLSLSV